MIGALLIVFFLAVVFLTRPNKKRDMYLLELWRVLKKSLRKRFGKKTISSVGSPVPVSRKSKIGVKIGGVSYESWILRNQTDIMDYSGVDALVKTGGDVEEIVDLDVNSEASLATIPQLEETSETKYQISEDNSASALFQIMESLETQAELSHSKKDLIDLPLNSHPGSFSEVKAALDKTPETRKEGHLIDESNKNSLNLSESEKAKRMFMIKKLQKKDEINIEEADTDDTIIEIEQTYQAVDYSDLEQELEHIVPEWPHTYIYSYTDLDRASTDQVKFYHKLKEKFLSGGWIDIGSNSNYAFILLFNLLREYNTHQDIKLLEEQFDRLGGYFPKTASYAKRFLVQKMREIDDTQGLERLEWSPANNYSYYEPWDWKDRYIKKLNLSKADIKLLENVYPPSTSFMGIEHCATEVIKLYIQVRKALHKAYQKGKLDQSTQFAMVLDILARKQYNFRSGSQNYQYVIANSTDTVLGFILKFCESKIRQHYAYTKTYSFMQNHHQELINAIQEHILSFVEDSIEKLMAMVEPPNDELEIELNATSTTRWKISFDLTEEYYQEHGKDLFSERANEILHMNAKNASLELIHLEISKATMLCDKQLSFEHFLKYAAQNLSGSRLQLKSMSQKMVKKLFPTLEQQTTYFTLMTALIRKEISLEQALLDIKDFYIPKRKKITLDTDAIKTVQVQHSGTVELLGEYLKEEEAEEIATEKVPLHPHPQPEIVSQSYRFNTNQIQADLIALFHEHNLSLNSEQLAQFCRKNGAMAGPMVNNLNETCYELIDDLLIEIEADNYTINPTYYAQIIST